MKTWSETVIKAKDLLALTREASKECVVIVAPSKPFIDEIKEKIETFNASHSFILNRALQATAEEQNELTENNMLEEIQKNIRTMEAFLKEGIFNINKQPLSTQMFSRQSSPDRKGMPKGQTIQGQIPKSCEPQQKMELLQNLQAQVSVLMAKEQVLTNLQVAASEKTNKKGELDMAATGAIRKNATSQMNTKVPKMNPFLTPTTEDRKTKKEEKNYLEKTWSEDGSEWANESGSEAFEAPKMTEHHRGDNNEVIDRLIQFAVGKERMLTLAVFSESLRNVDSEH